MQSAVKNAKSFSKDNISDHLKTLEIQLKELWSEYIKRLDESGLDDTARSLKDRYFQIYRRYRLNKKWREVMND